MKNKSAFSLIEIAIVILIIATLIIGVINGSALIRSSSIDSARSFTIKSAVPQIDGLVVWYETSLRESIKSSEAFNGAQISSWYDISPSSLASVRYDVISGTPTGQKNVLSKTASSSLIYQDNAINNLPSLYFSNSGNLTLSSFYQGSLSQSTIFIVFRPTSSLGFTILDSYTGNSTTSIGVSSNTINFNAGSSASTSTLSNSANFSIGGDYILAAYFNGSYSKAYVSNAENSAGNSNVSAGTNSLTGLTIGSNQSSGNAFTGLISEVIIFNRALSIQERRDVFKYLSYKYKISVTGI